MVRVMVMVMVVAMISLYLGNSEEDFTFFFLLINDEILILSKIQRKEPTILILLGVGVQQLFKPYNLQSKRCVTLAP